MKTAAPRILLWTDDPSRGGVAQYNHSLLLALAARGHRVYCVQPAGASPLVEAQLAAGVEHRPLPYDTVKEFGRTITDMDTPRAIFARCRPDLIVFSDCCPVSNLAARQAALALRIPCVVVIGFVAPYLARQFAPCVPVLARHYAAARRVIAVSEENLRLLRSHFGLGPETGEVVHYGRPPAFFAPPDPLVRQRLRADLGIGDNEILSLTAARLARLKGHHHQLAALHALAQAPTAPGLRFVWIGEGEERPALEAAIRRLGLEKRVTLLGHRWDAAAWYDAADLFVLPSEHEGMPLAIMEAMAKSLPVAASAVSGIPEELGPTGLLLPDPAADPRATVEALVRVFTVWAADPVLRRRLGRAAHERARELFQESLMLERTLAVIESHLPVLA